MFAKKKHLHNWKPVQINVRLSDVCWNREQLYPSFFISFYVRHSFPYVWTIIQDIINVNVFQFLYCREINLHFFLSTN